jgi:hypothetical protein
MDGSGAMSSSVEAVNDGGLALYRPVGDASENRRPVRSHSRRHPRATRGS